MTVTIIYDEREPQALEVASTDLGPLIVTGARVRVIVHAKVVFDTLDLVTPPPRAA